MGESNILSVIIHFGETNSTLSLMTSLANANVDVLVLINDDSLINCSTMERVVVESLPQNKGILGALRYSKQLATILEKYSGFLVLNNDLILREEVFSQFLKTRHTFGKEIKYFPVKEGNNITRGGTWSKVLLWPREDNSGLVRNDFDYFYGASFMFTKSALMDFLRDESEIFERHFLYFEELILKQWSERNNVSYVCSGDILFEHLKSVSTLKENRDNSFQARNFFLSRSLYCEFIATPRYQRVLADLLLTILFALKRNRIWLKALYNKGD